MKKYILALALAIASMPSFAQFSVIRGVNPSQTFVNLNADAQNNLSVNCVVGCGASAGTGGLSANGAAVTGNPVLVAGYDGTLTRTLKTDTSGQLNVNVVSGSPTTVTATPSHGTLVDKSGTITTGGTSQVLSTAKSRSYLIVENTSSALLYINFTSAASAGTGSIALQPYSSFTQEGSFVTSEAVNIFGATTGQTFTAKEF